MKIICESCRTKYSISDDKVRGKVFKIRCKKCQNVIVVKGNEGASGDAADNGLDSLEGGGGKPTMLSSSDASLDGEAASLDSEPPSRTPARTMISGISGGDSGGGGEWHLVLNGEQVGPFTPDDVAQKFHGGEINAETFIWKEGFSDWLPIAQIPEFSHLVASAPSAPAPAMADSEATNLYAASSSPKPPADPFGDAPAASDDLFGSPKGAPAQSAAAADPFQDDPFGGGDSAPPPAVAIQNSAPQGSMTAARSESSVLFSLTNLQALALGSKDAKPQAKPAAVSAPSTTATTEGSGLIDIRSMSGALQFSKDSRKEKESSAGVLDFGGDSAAAFAPAGMGSSMLLPVEPKSNSGLIIGIVVGGFLVVSVLTFGILFATGVIGGSKTVIVQQQGGAAAGTPSAGASGTPAAGGPTPAATGTPTDGTEPPVAVASAEPKATDPKAAAAGKDPKAAAGKDPKAVDPKAAAAGKDPAAAPAKNETTPPTVTPPADAGKDAGKHKDELDEILEGGTKSSSGGGGTGAPEKLSSSEISSGMGKGGYSSCKAIGTGKVTAKVTISSGGSVTSASCDPSDGLGSCVCGIVKRLKFSAISSPSQSFTYPVFVR